MTDHVEKFGLKVARPLHDFIEQEALAAAGVSSAVFWRGLSELVHEFGPRNRALLARRDELQAQIDAWHRVRRGQPIDPAQYRAFLQDIGYLVPEGPDFQIDTANVDPEIANMPGPQLVVPVMNARYALNAANARWGSLYDALYGTDAMGDLPPPGPYDPRRGARVIAWAKRFLDSIAPLASGSHIDATGYAVVDGQLVVQSAHGGATTLQQPAAFKGYAGDPSRPTSILLEHHSLRAKLKVGRSTVIGRDDPSGMYDLLLEAAVTTIMDCEDSVAAVDAEDKAAAYRNWLGLMCGDLVEKVEKGGRTIERALNADRAYRAPDGRPSMVKGRALMLVRNVGHLMTNPAVLDRDGNEAYEGLLDAMCTVMIGIVDLRKPEGQARNSTRGSIYVVKPKMHGPEEVAFADAVFTHVERVLGLPQYTVKLGIMDEERRTSVNLKECIRAAKSRVAFINTGFLDRTGDEIHTSMEAGAMVRKNDMKSQAWIQSYELSNVEAGLACGLVGRAQIGKGMWAMPDLMHAMLEQKIAHLKAGATCAWVPSPTGATLHATHYHAYDVKARQAELARQPRGERLSGILTIPLAPAGHRWSEAEILAEVENNAQGILGYVVRWVDQGVGCSKVPDINNVGLMEDRATCRISSQHIANWLHHGVVTREQVLEVMRRMAMIVDQQNAGDPLYRPMAPGFDGPAFKAACDLVFLGAQQPSGYTEPLLHQYRQVAKRHA
ncbi:MAG: malate synthase G [Gammaproteobacteria bacterium]|nr:malate synthase G [Gammaproteobacteria bacterium]